MNLSQLNDLDLGNVGAWPGPAKALAMLVLAGGILAAGYALDTRGMREELAGVQAQEADLLAEFGKRQTVIANLEAYRAQLSEMQDSLDSMLRQLPTGTEMPDLLEDISNTGVINGLVFDRFKPESEAPQEFYATQPISIRARGTYHQFGAFLSGVSALPRIVTVGTVAIVRPEKKDTRQSSAGAPELVLEATLNTYRYRDEFTTGGNQK
jgi:type IV pilus assembly protein PilO